MEIISPITSNCLLLSTETLQAWSKPLSPQALSSSSDVSTDSKAPSPTSYVAPSRYVDIRQFADILEKVNSNEEQMDFLNRLLKMDSSLLQRFASYKGLKIFSKMLSSSLSEDSLLVDVVNKVLVCLDRINIRPAVLEKLKIYSLVEEIKKHTKAPQEIVKKAFKLLIKWKDLIGSGNVEGSNGSNNNIKEDFQARNRIEDNFSHDLNKVGFANNIHKNNLTELLGKRKDLSVDKNTDAKSGTRKNKKNVRFLDDSILNQVKYFDKEEEPSKCSLTFEEMLFHVNLLPVQSVSLYDPLDPKTESKGILKKAKAKTLDALKEAGCEIKSAPLNPEMIKKIVTGDTSDKKSSLVSLLSKDKAIYKPDDKEKSLRHSPYQPSYKPADTELEAPRKMVKKNINYNPMSPYYDPLDNNPSVFSNELIYKSNPCGDFSGNQRASGSNNSLYLNNLESNRFDRNFAQNNICVRNSEVDYLTNNYNYSYNRVPNNQIPLGQVSHY